MQAMVAMIQVVWEPNRRKRTLPLKIALKLGSYIEENFPDVKVIYTRNKDVFVELA